jgi:hypothetical protein
MSIDSVLTLKDVRKINLQVHAPAQLGGKKFGMRTAISHHMQTIRYQIILFSCVLACIALANGNSGPPKNVNSTISSPGDCIQKLGRGENRFGVRVSVKALTRLQNGLKQFASAVTEPDRGLLVDYSMNSKAKRAFLIDFKTCDVLANEYVIHGGTVYHPVEQRFGNPVDDGMLKYCLRPNGSHQDMTRPGFFLTHGCHHSSEEGFTTVVDNCQGVVLQGLQSNNREAESVGVVLHEHESIPNDNSIKPVGQGCPAFPPGRLQSLLKYNIFSGALVFLYAPQCSI